ncbi:ATP-independent RNA helicase dbpA [Segatella buccae]|uniref:ATP-independent RNA helicase dbpA n=2 Tax=Segatella buccae TaxID=28126 RepID=A0AAQ1ZLD8_9BACT|nr:DEAD/DEAH box helicase [Segatella buccae]SUB96573.1 ATP-independent RNA helicase dbpA [Segatella buccae]
MTDKIIDKLGITLNDMQNDTAHAILHSNKDVVVLSPTGSGKTLAYLLPVVELLDTTLDAVQAVVVLPGRELALQSATVLAGMGSGLRAMACYGGRPAMDEHRTMRQVRPQVVFGTPGRLNDHLDKGNIETSQVRFVVIDEFDKCLEMGFHDEMAALMGKLPADARRVLLSATDADSIPHFVNLGRSTRVDYLSDDEQIPDRISIFSVHSPEKDKLATLSSLLLEQGDHSSIVFLNHRDAVERTGDYLRRLGFATSIFHGGLDQKMREHALYKFSNGSANILVSTDLASRGLDIPDVDNIIHYHLPETEEAYIHRVGRTARWQAEGRSFFVLGPEEHLPDYLHTATADHSPQPAAGAVPARPRMATVYIGKGKKDKISKGDILGFLCKKGGLENGEIGRIDVKDRYAYAAVAYPRLQELLDRVQGEKIKGVKTVVEAVR